LLLIHRNAFFIFPLLFAAAIQAAAPRDTGESQFSVSQTLFSTLAAINAAGYDAGMDSPLNDHYQLRTQIRQILASRKLECLPELRAFYKEHKKPTGAGDSFAGGFMGWLARSGSLTPTGIRSALIVGSVLASFCCEEFGLERFRSLTLGAIRERFTAFADLMHFEKIRF